VIAFAPSTPSAIIRATGSLQSAADITNMMFRIPTKPFGLSYPRNFMD
jgi:hypothetical protein